MKVNREKLLCELESVRPGLTPKETIEQSSCFVFKDGRVMTFNDEVFCSIGSSLEEIEGAIKADPLLNLLRKMKEEDVDVQLKDGALLVRDVKNKGRSKRAKLRMEDEIRLPVDEVEVPEDWNMMDDKLVELIEMVYSCVSKDESQFVNTCVHIHPDFVEACDNYQMCRCPVSTGLKEPVLIRKGSLVSISGLGMVEFGETDSWFHFRNPSGMVLSCRRYVEDYANLGAFLDVAGKKIRLPEGLKEAIATCEVFSNEGADSTWVEVSIRSDQIVLKGEGPNGSYCERKKLKPQFEGDPIRFNVNPHLLVQIVDKSRTCIVSEDRMKVEGDGFAYVVCTNVPDDREEE